MRVSAIAFEPGRFAECQERTRCKGALHARDQETAREPDDRSPALRPARSRSGPAATRPRPFPRSGKTAVTRKGASLSCCKHSQTAPACDGVHKGLQDPFQTGLSKPAFGVSLAVRGRSPCNRQGQKMNVPRAFLVTGSLFLVLGIGLGMHMGASGDHTLYPLHAHINLLGFALMSIFGLIYHTFPAMAGSVLARAHFWLHLAGSLVLLMMLFCSCPQRITEAAMFPVAPVAELAVFIGVLSFVYNLWRNGR